MANEQEKEILTQLLSLIISQTKDIEFLRKDYNRVLSEFEKINKEIIEIKELLTRNLNGGFNAKLTTIEGETQEKGGFDIMETVSKIMTNLSEKQPELTAKLIDKGLDKFGNIATKISGIMGA